MSGGTNSSTRCSNLAQEASRRCWRLRCSWQSRKKKSLVPTGGLQENEHREENWENLLGPQAKCQITSWRATGHGNWPWKKRMTEERRYSTGSPKETVAVGDPESQCPGAGGLTRRTLWECWLCQQQGTEQPKEQATTIINGDTHTSVIHHQVE